MAHKCKFWRGLVFTAAALLLVLTLVPAMVSAHAAFVRAEPAPGSALKDPPGSVTVWFTEPVEPRFSSIKVLDVTGREVSTGAPGVLPGERKAISVPLPRLDEGRYTVSWRNMSTVDGHALSGSFVFSVGDIPPSTTEVHEPSASFVTHPATPVFRWLTLLTLLAVFGGLTLELLVWGPALMGGIPGRERAGLYARMARRSDAMYWAALAVFFVASVGLLLTQTASAGNLSLAGSFGEPAIDLVTGTRWGRFWLLRSALVLGMAAMFLAGNVSRKKAISAGNSGTSPSRPWFTVGFVAIGALLSTSLMSHAAAATGIEAPAILNDFLHLTAASVWVGGLFHLALHSGLLNSRRIAGNQSSLLALVVPKFSAVAVVSVGTLAVTGLFGMWAHVASFSALATPYGYTLLAKIGLFASLLAFGAINLLRLSPRLASQVTAGQALARSVRAEAIIGVVLLLATGFLTGMEPARQSHQENSHIVVLKQEVQSAKIEFTVDPAHVGSNRLAAEVTDHRGNPIPESSQVLVSFTSIDTSVGQTEAVGMERGRDAVFTLRDAPLTVAGKWQATLFIVRPDTFDAQVTFEFGIDESDSEPVPSTSSGRTAWLFLAAEGIVLGIMLRVIALVKPGFFGGGKKEPNRET